MQKLLFLVYLRTNKRNTALYREEERSHQPGAEGGKYDKSMLYTCVKIQ